MNKRGDNEDDDLYLDWQLVYTYVWSCTGQHGHCHIWKRQQTRHNSWTQSFLINSTYDVVNMTSGGHSLFRRLTAPPACVRCTNGPVFWLFLLPIDMYYFAVLHMRKGNWLSLGKVSEWLRLGQNYWVGHINPTQRLSLGKQSLTVMINHVTRA